MSICLVTIGLAGPTGQGGIAKAFRGLAEHLAAQPPQPPATGPAHSPPSPNTTVTVLFAGLRRYMAGGAESAERWVREFAAAGVRLVLLPEAWQRERFYGPEYVVRSFHVYRWLRQHAADFDVVSFHDYLGIGYFTALAKHQGLAFANIPLIAQCHSTARWTDLMNLRPPKDHNTLAYYHMEARSVALADIRVSPSRYFLGWTMEHGLEGVLPTAAHTEPPGLNLVIPNIMLGRQGRQQGPPQAPKAQQLPAGLSAASHFVFFGRLEARKGLWVFCNALLRLADADRPVLPTRVTFLGPETMIGKKRSVAAIREHLADHGHSVAALASAGCSIAFETKRDTAQAMAVLREPSTVAFVPAVGDNFPYVVMELLAHGLPFVTTSVGGIPEMIAPEHRAAVTVPVDDPQALADRMLTALRSGLPTAKAAAGLFDGHTKYAEVFQTAAAKARLQRPTGTQANTNPPARHVVVGISSHNRPSTLVRAAKSILAQSPLSSTAPRHKLTLVIVDDASTAPGMDTALHEIEQAAQTRGITFRLVRNSKNSFVARVRNQLLAEAAALSADLACLMDDDDVAKPHMVATYMQVAEATGADVVTDFAEAYDELPARYEDISPLSSAAGAWAGAASTLGARGAGVAYSHLSLAVGNALAHNFFVNDFGKANFCVRPDKALAVGGHGTGEFSNSPFVDWSFLTRASAAGLRIEVVPDALYLYTKDSEGSIWTHRQSDADRFRGHMKMLEDMAPLVAAHPTAGSPARRRDLWDILGFCRLKLGLPQIRGGGPV